MLEVKNNYELLCGKRILQILDGDTEFGELDSLEFGKIIKISMPRLSGPMLCDISNKFGLPVSYGSGAESRWVYLDNTIRHCSKWKTVPKLLCYLFSKEQFANKLSGLSVEKIDKAHKLITEEIIKRINGELCFSGYVLKNDYCLDKIDDNQIKIDVPFIDKMKMSREYISDVYRRASEDVEGEKLDSAITKSRTLLEEVFCYAVEQAGCEPSDNGKINDLYNQVKQSYNMHSDKNVDKRINDLLSGLNKIVGAVSDMRNKTNSDSHGMGAKRINISKHLQNYV